MPERKVTIGERKTGKWATRSTSDTIKPNTYYELHYKLSKRPWLVQTIVDWLNYIRRRTLEDVAIDTIKKIKEEFAKKLNTKPENIIVNWFMYDDDTKDLKMQIMWKQEKTVAFLPAIPVTWLILSGIISGTIIISLYLTKSILQSIKELVQEGVEPEEVLGPIERAFRTVFYITLVGGGIYLIGKVISPIIKAKFPEKKTGG